MNQSKRTNTFFEFSNAPLGTLLSTDVAARGLDIPAVDWIIQFDPPDDHKSYIHRVGRTARAGKSGNSLLFLLESELGFLRYLREARVPLNEYSFPTERIANVQTQLEKLLQKNFYLYDAAKKAYQSYLRSYATSTLKKVFDVNKLDLTKVGKAFGFSVPPSIDLGTIKKRKYDDDDDDDAEERVRVRARNEKGMEKRKEALGRRKVEKEVYRKEKVKKVDENGRQLSRF